MAQAYPLAWPMGVPRTPAGSQRSSRFEQRTIAKAYGEVERQLSMLGAASVVISTDIPLKRDGRPYSDPRSVDDVGVAVYFHLRGKSYCMPCDRWCDVDENLWAIAKHIEAMRGQMRWGVASIEQAFAGFKALPAEGESADSDCWTVLGLSPMSSEEEIKAAWRSRAMEAHPDRNGSHDEMAMINGARWERDIAQPPPGTWVMKRVGKRTAGRVLDGRTWDEFPEVVECVR